MPATGSRRLTTSGFHSVHLREVNATTLICQLQPIDGSILRTIGGPRGRARWGGDTGNFFAEDLANVVEELEKGSTGGVEVVTAGVREAEAVEGVLISVHGTGSELVEHELRELRHVVKVGDSTNGDRLGGIVGCGAGVILDPTTDGDSLEGAARGG